MIFDCDFVDPAFEIVGQAVGVAVIAVNGVCADDEWLGIVSNPTNICIGVDQLVVDKELHAIRAEFNRGCRLLAGLDRARLALDGVADFFILQPSNEFIVVEIEAEMTAFTKILGILGYKTLRPICLLYTSPSPRDQRGSRMPSSA